MRSKMTGWLQSVLPNEARMDERRMVPAVYPFRHTDNWRTYWSSNTHRSSNRYQSRPSDFEAVLVGRIHELA